MWLPAALFSLFSPAGMLCAAAAPDSFSVAGTMGWQHTASCCPLWLEEMLRTTHVVCSPQRTWMVSCPFYSTMLLHLRTIKAMNWGRRMAKRGLKRVGKQWPKKFEKPHSAQLRQWIYLWKMESYKCDLPLKTVLWESYAKSITNHSGKPRN